MTRLVVALVVVLAPAVASAQTAAEVVAGVEKFYAGTKQATSRFQQLVTDPTFGGQPQVSAGTVFVEKPGKMRWDYDSKRKGQKPKKNFIADGKNLYYVDHVNKQVTVSPLTTGMMPAAVGYLLGTGSLAKDFTPALASASPYAKSGHTVVELTPITASAAIKQLVLVVDGSGQVAKTIVIDSQDRTNEFELYDPDFKTAIAKTQFVFDAKKHKGYKVIKPRPAVQPGPAPAPTP
jgi:outer membrane lipoprotein-sorting protein